MRREAESSMAALKVFSIGCLYFLFIAHYVVADEQCSLSPQPFLLRLGNCSIPADPTEYPDGVNSWGILLSIASQNLCLVPSTVVNNLAVVGAEVCAAETIITADQCYSSHGGFFNESDATSDFTAASPQDILVPDESWDELNPPFTMAGNTTIQLSSITLPDFPIAIISSGSNFSESQLGLANDSVFLHSIVSAGLSSVAGFGMLAGSQSVSSPREGHIIFGGFDTASLADPFTNYSISNTTGAGTRVCPLQIIVDELTLVRPGLPDKDLVSTGDSMPSCIEIYDNFFRLPPNVLEEFQQATGWINETSLMSPQLYVIEPPLIYNNTGFNGTLRFKLRGGLEVEIPNEELTQPLRGLDPTGKIVLQDNVTQVNIFSEGDPLNTASLGKIFLSQLYLTVNYDEQQFQLAPAVTDSVVAPELVPFKSSISITCSSDSPDDWWIGVIILSCILAIVLILASIFLFRRRRTINNRLNGLEARDSEKMEKVPVELSNGRLSETSQRVKNVLQRVQSGGTRPSIISVGTVNEPKWDFRRESSIGPVSPHTEGYYSPMGELAVSPRTDNPAGPVGELEHTDGGLSPAQELPVSGQKSGPFNSITELSDN